MKVKTLICADSIDSKLGDVFLSMSTEAHRICSKCSKIDIENVANIVELKNDIDKSTINSILPSYNQSPFIFCAFMHGDAEALYMGNDIFVSNEENVYLFTKSFIYTFSCCTGDILADSFMKNDACVFIGYKDSVYIPIYGQDQYVHAALSGLKKFFEESGNATQAYNSIYSAYSNMLLDNTLDPISRMFAQHNRDCLVIKGDKNVTLKDFIIQD